MSWKRFEKKHKSLVKTLSRLSSNDIPKYLLKNGFEKLDGFPLYRNKHIIIKRKGIICGKLNKLPQKYVIPTIEFKSASNRIWFVQARAVTVQDLYRAVEDLEDKCPQWNDSHDGNVGWYNGKPVIIDW